ncbi:hypothetical protein [Streptomyces aculeolatus]|uniref:hypothetical protein n=1 Tax=Streptomyces aculeolatus TaxID=270689 RepID=UPI001CECD5E6|nr:hypothetical protein [Streptomyces aculeolatus]
MPLAHGVGGTQDLPIPAFYAYAGGFAALLVSFLALGLLWPEPRYAGATAGRPLPRAVQRLAASPALRRSAAAAGLAAAAFVAGHLLLGPDDPARNPAPGAVYVLLWVGLVPASLLLGPVWRLLNPLRTLHALACRALGRDPSAGRPLPPWLGHRPAAAGLLAFTWLELAAPEPAATTALSAFLAAHAAVQLTGAALHGERWFAQCDPFEAYSALLARLSPVGRRPADGVLVLRSPLAGLDATPALPGLTAVLCVLLGSTAYDGFSAAPSWIDTLQTSSLGRTATATLGLLAAVALVAALYAACAAAVRLVSGRLAHPLSAFAHSLLPIALGYLVAHYFTLFVTEGPRTVTIASGTDNPPPADPLLSPGGLAALQVLAVVTGHVLGVVAAHDRAVRLFPAARAVAGQLPLLALMVCYTVGGLTLLLAA